MFGEMLQKGLGAAGWVIGFVAALGLFTMVVALICMLFSFIANGDGEDEDGEGENHECEDQ